MEQKRASTPNQPHYKTGRRKTSKARVFLTRAPERETGKITVNGKDLDTYFSYPAARTHVLMPFKVKKVLGQFNCVITVAGGGIMGQAGAIRYGIAHALVNYYEDKTDTLAYEPQDIDLGSQADLGEKSCRKIFRAAKLLTRDSRIVERKKYGFRKARKRPQYSKR